MVFGADTKPMGRPARKLAAKKVADPVHMGKKRMRKLVAILKRNGGFDDLIEQLVEVNKAHQARAKTPGPKGVATTELDLLLYSSNLVEDEPRATG